MHIDNRLRQGLIGAADTIEVSIERDLADLRSTARQRYRQRVLVLAAAAAALALVTGLSAPKITSMVFGLDRGDLAPVDQGEKRLLEDEPYRVEVPRPDRARAVADLDDAKEQLVRTGRRATRQPRAGAGVAGLHGPGRGGSAERAATQSSPPQPAPAPRVLSQPYAIDKGPTSGPIFAGAFGDCASDDQDGCVEFRATRGEVFVQLQIHDRAGAAVAGIVGEYTQDGRFNDLGSFCSHTTKRLSISPGSLVVISIEPGGCGGDESAPADRGHVVATFFGGDR